jgi:hypothetical protein
MLNERVWTPTLFVESIVVRSRVEPVEAGQSGKRPPVRAVG